MDGRGRGRGGRGRGGRVAWRGGRGRGPPGLGEQDPGRGGRGRGRGGRGRGPPGLGEQDPGRGGRGRGRGEAAEAAVEAAAAAAVEAAAAEAVDAGPFPGLGDGNPFFVGVPSCNFRLSGIALEMRNSHEQVWIWVKRKLAERQHRMVINHLGEVKEFSLLPEGGFFIVNLIPAEDWVDDVRPIPLVFSFRDLYFLGFAYGTVWHMYNDSNLDGTGYVEGKHDYFLQLLNFGGGYNGMFDNVYVGVSHLHVTYDILVHLQNHSQPSVETAMYRLIIALPESWRFPGWRSHLQDTAFALLEEIFADEPYSDVEFSFYFLKWDKISKRILGGSDKYIGQRRLDGFPDYASLLGTVSVILR